MKKSGCLNDDKVESAIRKIPNLVGYGKVYSIERHSKISQVFPLMPEH